MATKPSLVLKRRIKAAPEKVYEAWTRPEQMTLWWGVTENPKPPVAETDLRVGGRFRVQFWDPQERAPQRQRHLSRGRAPTGSCPFPGRGRARPSASRWSPRPQPGQRRHHAHADATSSSSASKARDDHGRGWGMALDPAGGALSMNLISIARRSRSAIRDAQGRPAPTTCRTARRAGECRAGRADAPARRLDLPGDLSSAQGRAGTCPLVEEMLTEIVAARCAAAARARGRRRAPSGVCRHFTLLHVAMLRPAGHPGARPLRLRCILQQGRSTSTIGSPNTGTTSAVPGCCSISARWPISGRSSRLVRPGRRARADQFLVAGDCWQMCRTGQGPIRWISASSICSAGG